MQFQLDCVQRLIRATMNSFAVSVLVLALGAISVSARTSSDSPSATAPRARPARSTVATDVKSDSWQTDRHDFKLNK
uniref:Uncharacterized protein n=1 Tax=Anopheles minimus TaxID=112268 RepID=A0A182W5V7_9DIPT